MVASFQFSLVCHLVASAISPTEFKLDRVYGSLLVMSEHETCPFNACQLSGSLLRVCLIFVKNMMGTTLAGLHHSVESFTVTNCF